MCRRGAGPWRTAPRESIKSPFKESALPWLMCLRAPTKPPGLTDGRWVPRGRDVESEACRSARPLWSPCFVPDVVLGSGSTATSPSRAASGVREAQGTEPRRPACRGVNGSKSLEVRGCRLAQLRRGTVRPQRASSQVLPAPPALAKPGLPTASPHGRPQPSIRSTFASTVTCVTKSHSHG